MNDTKNQSKNDIYKYVQASIDAQCSTKRVTYSQLTWPVKVAVVAAWTYLVFVIIAVLQEMLFLGYYG